MKERPCITNLAEAGPPNKITRKNKNHLKVLVNKLIFNVVCAGIVLQMAEAFMYIEC